MWLLPQRAYRSDSLHFISFPLFYSLRLIKNVQNYWPKSYEIKDAVFTFIEITSPNIFKAPGYKLCSYMQVTGTTWCFFKDLKL